MNKHINRKDFLKYTGLGAGGVMLSGLLLGCEPTEEAVGGNNTESRTKYKWRIQTHWPPGVEYYQLYKAFCDHVRIASGGELDITPYAPGDIVSTGDMLESVGQGQLEMGFTFPSYWIGKMPVAGHLNGQVFTWESLDEMWMFLFEMGAFEIIQKAYDDFNLHLLPPYSCAGLAVYSKKPVKSLDDFKGLSIRSTGIPAEVFKKAGASPVFLPGEELYSSLQTGVVDAAHWGAVAAGWEMGFQEVTNYIIRPNFAGVTNGDIYVNKDAWSKLPDYLKGVLYDCASWASINAHAWFAYNDYLLMDRFVNDGYGEIVTMEDDAIKKMRQYSLEVIDEYSQKDPEYCGKVGEKLKEFLRMTGRI